MSRILGVAVLAAVAAGLTWWWWQEAKRPVAEAWAAETDPLA